MRVGIIIGRFQVDQLTPGHLNLIREASAKSDQVLILIGSTHKPPSHNNPLTFEMRRGVIWKAMLEELDKTNAFARGCDYAVLPFPDHHDNETWVRNLDALIETLYRNDTVTIYVGRMSGMEQQYKDHKGKHKVIRVTSPADVISGTDRRTGLYNLPESKVDIKTVIWTTQHQYTKVYPTVDIACFDRAGNLILIRKKGEKLWRFPGGFVGPSDASYEAAAFREFREECGDVEVSLTYVASLQIDDWRYRGEKDKIITTFFMGQLLWGGLRCGDDAIELTCVAFPTSLGTLVPEHRRLYACLGRYIHEHGRPRFPNMERKDA